MDPNANLAEQLALASTILGTADATYDVRPEDAVALATLVRALDVWLDGGHSLPARWLPHRPERTVSREETPQEPTIGNSDRIALAGICLALVLLLKWCGW